MGGMLDGIKSRLKSNAKFTWADAEFLETAKGRSVVGHAGVVPPRAKMAEWVATSIKRALAKGLTFRPLAETARDTLAWFKTQPPERQAK